MYYSEDKFEHTPDIRDEVTGDWLPMSESQKARQIRAEDNIKAQKALESANMSQVLKLMTSIFK